MQKILKKNEKNLAQSLNFMLYLHVFMYIDVQCDFNTCPFLNQGTFFVFVCMLTILVYKVS
jgi:hypothetical protein